MADGSVNIAVNMNVGKAQKKLDKLKEDIQKTQDDISETTEKRDKAKDAAVFQEKELENEKKALDEMQADLKAMEEAKVAGDNLDKARKNAEKISKDLEATKENLSVAEDTSTIQAAQLDEGKQRLADMEMEQASRKRGSPDYKDAAIDIKEQKERVNGLKKEWEKTEASVQKYKGQIEETTAALNQAKAEVTALEVNAPETPVSGEDIAAQKAAIKEQTANVKSLETGMNRSNREIEKYNIHLDEANSKLGRQVNDAGQLEQNIARANAPLSRVKDALTGAGDSADHFAKRIKKLASRVFVFTLITRALRALRTWLWNSIQANDEAAQAVANLKGALLTLAQPILNVVIPAFTWLVNLLTKIVAAVARVVSLIFGSDIARSAASAQKSLENEASAIGDVGAAAKEAAGSLAGFDEINTIDTSAPSGGGGGGGGGEPGGATPDFTSLIDSSLDAIVELFFGTAMLALGAILTFTGANIPLGIALLALGAALIWDSIAPDNGAAIKSALQGPLGAVFALAMVALLEIGLILCFTGHVAAGVALIAMGVVGLITVAAINGDAIVNFVSKYLTDILILVGTALLAIGIVLAVTSPAHLGLGIALIAAGAAALIGAAAVNGDAVVNYIENHLSDILIYVGTALLAVGLLLAILAPAHLGLGISLIAAGAAALIAVAVINKDSVVSWIKDKLDDIVSYASAAVLALGIILAIMSPAHLALGIGMIAVGAIGLAAVAFVNWDNLSAILQGKIGVITAIASGALIALGVILVFAGPATLPLGLGMLAIGAIGLVSTIAANWDWILEKLKGIWASITSWWHSNVGTGIEQAIGGIKETFGGLLDFITGVFTGDWSQAWEGIKEIFSGVWDGITGILKTAANLAISLVEGLINLAISAVNGIIAGINGVGALADRIGLGWHIEPLASVQIPRLAQGAVIPPNREFMAVLGDQKSGNNIEAPESLIRQIVREESGGGNAAILREILSAIREGKVMVVDRQVLARTAVKGINDLTVQAGKPVLLI